MEWWGETEEGGAVCLRNTFTYSSSLLFLAMWRGAEVKWRGEGEKGEEGERKGQFEVLHDFSGHLGYPHLASKFQVSYETQVWILYETLWDSSTGQFHDLGYQVRA